jgi:hypothetical protein
LNSVSLWTYSSIDRNRLRQINAITIPKPLRSNPMMLHDYGEAEENYPTATIEVVADSRAGKDCRGVL